MLLLIFFFSCFVLSWAISRFVRRRAISYYQKNNMISPTSSVRILPDGAGLSIVATWYLALSYLAFTEHLPFKLFLAQVPGLFLVVAIIVDEVKKLPAYFRFVVHAAVVASSLYILGGVNTFTFGSFVWDSQVSLVVMNVVAFIILTWLINVFRFYDGIDGKEGNLAAVTIAICAMACFVAPKYNAIFCLIPCMAGFLVRNWYPARYVMGDAAASFLGFTFGVFAIYYQSRELPEISSGLPFFVTIMLAFVPLFDVTYTLVRRLMNGDSVLVPTKNHLYQRLLYSGFSHTKVILTQLVLCAIVLALCLAYFCFETVIAAGLLLIAAFAVMGIYAYWVEKRYPYQKESAL